MLVARSYAISLGAIALGLIALRGAISGDLVLSVLTQGLAGLVIFCGVGYVVGAIADQVIRQTVEDRFRQRVAEVASHIQQRAAERNTPNAP